MSITTYLSELDSINTEINRLRILLKNLNNKKNILEENVQEWLQNNNQKSISHNGKIISIYNKMSSKRKKQSEKVEDLSQVLRKYGMNNKKIINEILEVNKGNKVEITKLNFKKK
tara:strand:- start:38 stop:382 length:345 start_codon:yes stop_codon:yes gene_type:complete